MEKKPVVRKPRVSTIRKKKIFLEALRKSHGVIQSACDTAKIDRTTYWKWMQVDDKFKALVEDESEAAIDFVETKLYQNIDKGKEISTIFYLKTRAKHRGYVEASQLDITSGGDKLVFNFGNNQDEPPQLNIKDVDE